MGKVEMVSVFSWKSLSVFFFGTLGQVEPAPSDLPLSAAWNRPDRHQQVQISGKEGSGLGRRRLGVGVGFSDFDWRTCLEFSEKPFCDTCRVGVYYNTSCTWLGGGTCVQQTCEYYHNETVCHADADGIGPCIWAVPLDGVDDMPVCGKPGCHVHYSEKDCKTSPHGRCMWYEKGEREPGVVDYSYNYNYDESYSYDYYDSDSDVAQEETEEEDGDEKEKEKEPDFTGARCRDAPECGDAEDRDTCELWAGRDLNCRWRGGRCIAYGCHRNKKMKDCLEGPKGRHPDGCSWERDYKDEVVCVDPPATVDDCIAEALLPAILEGGMPKALELLKKETEIMETKKQKEEENLANEEFMQDQQYSQYNYYDDYGTDEKIEATWRELMYHLTSETVEAPARLFHEAWESLRSKECRDFVGNWQDAPLDCRQASCIILDRVQYFSHRCVRILADVAEEKRRRIKALQPTSFKECGLEQGFGLDLAREMCRVEAISRARPSRRGLLFLPDLELKKSQSVCALLLGAAALARVWAGLGLG